MRYAQVGRERRRCAREEVYRRVVDARRSIDHLFGKEEFRLVQPLAGAFLLRELAGQPA